MSLTNFIKKHPVISTIALIAVVDIVLLIAAYFGLGAFTHHNQFQVVPDLKGMAVDEAESVLRKHNLTLEISDSIFDKRTKPGTIMIQTPKEGSKIKNNRTVYVTIRSFATQMVTIPSVSDMSLRQGMSMLQAAGITDINVERIPSEYTDLVYYVKMNGLTLHAGDKVPVNAKITIVAGDGMQQQSDSMLLEQFNDTTNDAFQEQDNSVYE